MPGSASSFARARQLTPQAPKRAELHLSFNITGPSSRLRTTLGALTLAILIATMLVAAGSASRARRRSRHRPRRPQRRRQRDADEVPPALGQGHTERQALGQPGRPLRVGEGPQRRRAQGSLSRRLHVHARRLEDLAEVAGRGPDRLLVPDPGGRRRPPQEARRHPALAGLRLMPSRSRSTDHPDHVVRLLSGSARGSSWISLSARGTPASSSRLRSRSAFSSIPKSSARFEIQTQTSSVTTAPRLP